MGLCTSGLRDGLISDSSDQDGDQGIIQDESSDQIKLVKSRSSSYDSKMVNVPRSLSEKQILQDLGSIDNKEDQPETHEKDAGYILVYENSDDGSDYFQILEEITKEDLQRAFEHVDDDNDGQIYLKQFCLALEHLHLNWEMENAEKVFAELDAESRLRTIDLSSFYHACHMMEPRLKEFWRTVRKRATTQPTKRQRALTALAISTTEDELKLGDKKSESLSQQAKQFSPGEKIKDVKTYPWKERIEALHEIAQVGILLPAELFEKFFDPLCGGICSQIVDQRSVVVKECCIALATLFSGMQDQRTFQPFIQRILEALFQSLQITIQIISESAYQCCEHLIKAIPDDQKSLPLLKTITQHAKSNPHARVREACYSFLSEYITLPGSLCLSEPPDSEIWRIMAISILAGTMDSHSAVRLSALHALVSADTCPTDTSKKLAAEIESKLKKSSQERYNGIRFPDRKPKSAGKKRISPIQRRKEELRKTKAIIKRRVAKAKERVIGVAVNRDADKDGAVTAEELSIILRELGYTIEIESQVTSIFTILEAEQTLPIEALANYFGGLVQDDPNALPEENMPIATMVNVDSGKKPQTRGRRVTITDNRRRQTITDGRRKSRLMKISGRSRAISKSIQLMGERVKQVVESLDEQKTGYFAAEHLIAIWEELGMGSATKDMDKCRRELEEGGRINKELFFTWWFDDRITKQTVETKYQKLLKRISEDDIKKSFQKCDTDGDGVLSFREFCFAMESLGLQWSLDDAKAAFKMIDENHDKSIDFEEFKAGIYHIHADHLEVFWTRLLTGEVEEQKEVVEEKYTKELITELLKDKKGDWRKRVKAMRNLVILLGEFSDEDFQKEFETWSEKLTLQVQDRRSQVSRAASECVGKIIAQRKHAFHPFVTYWFPELVAVVRMTGVKVVSQSAHQLCKVLVRNVHDTDLDHYTLDAIIGAYFGCKHKLLKKASFEYLTIILEQISQKNPNFPFTNEYLDKIEKLLAAGMSDSDPGTRKQAYTALAFLSFIDETRSSKIMDGMSRVVLKKYKRIKNRLAVKN